jgi:hypothetical protein
MTQELQNKTVNCIGCGAIVSDIEGPGYPSGHDYMPASPGCFKLYGDLLAKEYAPENYDPAIHRISVDTYAVSHPGKPERRAIQSVNVHLARLFLVLDKDFSTQAANEHMLRLLENRKAPNRWQWLEPPNLDHTLHITDVVKARDFAEHARLVRAWGRSLLDAWKQKHLNVIESYFVHSIRLI